MMIRRGGEPIETAYINEIHCIYPDQPPWPDYAVSSDMDDICGP